MTNRSLSGQRIRPEEWLLIACILFTFLWRFVAMLWIPALYPLNDYFPMLWAALAACLARGDKPGGAGACGFWARGWG